MLLLPFLIICKSSHSFYSYHKILLFLFDVLSLPLYTHSNCPPTQNKPQVLKIPLF